MTDTLQAMRQLEERFVRWAQGRDDIRMAVVVGSWARTDHPADEWSDLDVGFSTTQPASYLRSDAWLSEIANVWLWYPDETGVTRHVLFEGGLDAGLAPIAHNSVTLAVRFVPVLRRLPAPLRRGIERQLAEAALYMGRGVRVILDKDDLAPKFLALLPPIDETKAAPSERAFRELVSKFWFEAAWSAKHLRRGEVWYAKCAAADGRMKTLLLRMMEWHALATHGATYDTWTDGRFLEEWGDPRALAQLRDAFGRYDGADVRRALPVSMDLFRWLAVETAERLGYAYAVEADRNVSEWVTACLSEGSAAE